MNKELLLLTHDLGIGGSQMVVINLANEALRNNFVVKIITFSNNNILENKLIKSDNLFIYNLNKSNSSKGLFKKLYLFFTFLNYINIHKPKLVHSHLWEIDIMYLYVFFFFNNVHIIHTLHSPGGSYINNNMLSKFVVKIEKYFINQYNKLNLILVSEQISVILKNILLYKKKYTVITNGIDINNYYISKRKNTLFNDLPSDSKIFIFPSRYQPSKGHLLLFKALKKILLDDKKVYLLLVGSNLEENLKFHAINLKIDSNVIFYGESNNVSELINNCHYGIFPSEYEGTPIALGELLLMSIPTVASDILPNLLMTNFGRTAILFKQNSVNDLYLAMKKILDDNDFANEVSIKAREFIINNYTSEIMFKKHNSIYNEV